MAGAMTLETVQKLLGRLTFRNWKFRAGKLDDGCFIQLVFDAPDTDTPDTMQEQRGRKWYISSYAIPDEVVKTAWAAVQMAETHEMLEEFKLDGVAIFHAHTNVFELQKLQEQEGARVFRDSKAQV